VSTELSAPVRDILSTLQPRAAASRGATIKWWPISQHMLIICVFLIYAFPIFWMVTLSFKADADAFVLPPKLAFSPTLSQYQNLLANWPFVTFYRNSLIIVAGALSISTALAIPLAYSLARFRWRHKRDISFFVLSQLMLPPEGIVVPIYLMFQRFTLLGTLWAPMLIYIVFALPFITWIMKGFFESAPVEIEEAALVDGASRYEVVWRIVLPLALGSLTSTVMLAAITLWNEFFFAFVLTNVDTYTAPVAILGLWTQYQVYWGQIAAAGVLVSLPIVGFGLIVQRHLVRGLTLGAVK
jgi:multiple sugar transport system permease protein